MASGLRGRIIVPLPYVDCMACLYFVSAEASLRLGDPALAQRLREFAIQNVPQRYWCAYSAHRLLGVPLDADNPRIGIELRKRRRQAAA